MTTRYAEHVSINKTPQTEAIPGTNQQQNNAGGFSFIVNDWTQFDRFLILGCASGSYYAGEREMTKDHAACVIRCGVADGLRAVNRIIEVSTSGRATKNDPAIFALALLASSENQRTREYALGALPVVARTGTHLFAFVDAANSLRGWGRGLRNAVASWYTGKQPKDAAFQCVKYQSRDKWSHRDLLRLSHPKVTGTLADVLHWVVKGWPGVGEDPHPDAAMLPIWAFERAKRATDRKEVVRLIRDYRLVRECIPTQFLNEPEVWEALLADMPMTAMIRNLGKMTSVGLLTPLSSASKLVCDALGNQDALRKARVHPLSVLLALSIYKQGKGDKGKLTWTPDQTICNALDQAFYLAFGAITPTGKRHLIALDVSGSMASGTIAGMPGMTPRVVSAALAMATTRTEANYHVIGFTSPTSCAWGLHRQSGFSAGVSPIPINSRMRLDDVIKTVSGIPFGGTDCSLPMLYAAERKTPFDCCTIFTDNETYAGAMHPSQALREYRQKMGIPARLCVVGMTATKFTIADPNDAGMLDVTGCDVATPQVISEFAMGNV